MMRSKKIIIVSKTRFVIFVTLVLLILGFISSEFFKFEKVYSATYDKWIEITISKGDTLWQIAKNNNPNNHDIRKVVFEIMEYNDMEDANIMPGDVIKIPLTN